MSDYTLRTANLTDAERLAHIGVATFIDSYTFDIDGDAMIAHCTAQHAKSVYASYLADPKSELWLAEYKTTGAPIGYALVCPPDLPVECHEHDVELKRIYVLSRFHGSGAGVGLLAKATISARQAGANRLLGTYEENYRAMAFYARNGFETIGRRKFKVGDKYYDDIVMAKPL